MTVANDASVGEQIDLLMAAAWPPAIVETSGDWLLRSTSGVTRRANSALVIGEPSGATNLARAIDAAESFYGSHGAEPVFMVTDASAGPSVAPALRDRDYSASATTAMLMARSDHVASRGGVSADWSVEVTDVATDDWFATYWSVEKGRRSSDEEAAVVRDVLLRPDSPARFVAVRSADTADPADGRIAAVGQVVIADGWGCCQCLATADWARRRGAGSAVMSELAIAAAHLDAAQLFCAVMVDNAASLALCNQLGFVRSHTYSYFA